MIAIGGTIISVIREMLLIPPKIITATNKANRAPTIVRSSPKAFSNAIVTVFACTELKINPYATVIRSENQTPIQRLFNPFSI
ncbi:Uncharacterised protein [Streptococcus pneumoniae]|nr:Uncharacterised protein [Streptococcus pneumoniae]